MIIEPAPASSPPTAKPWINRRATSMIGAQIPIAAYDGSSPTHNVENPISIMHRTRTFFLPCLSPQCPRMNAPRGRAT